MCCAACSWYVGLQVLTLAYILITLSMMFPTASDLIS